MRTTATAATIAHETRRRPIIEPRPRLRGAAFVGRRPEDVVPTEELFAVRRPESVAFDIRFLLFLVCAQRGIRTSSGTSGVTTKQHRNGRQIHRGHRFTLRPRKPVV
ncbi:MAG: hypothetical protein BGO26_06430 [Actinobacteria bacterium 69-20]|nr:MAG: hypothetical protein BGO26_06430 [Actinobacteria bacterium 69-20]